MDIHVTNEPLKIWDESELLKIALKTDMEKEVRVRTAITMPQKEVLKFED